jgi:hypothetical protein
MRSVRIGQSALSLAMFLGLLQAQDRPPLTNQRIYDLYTAGVSQLEIIRIISGAPKIDFNLQPAETDALMKAGVSDYVIKAMAARESGAPIPPPREVLTPANPPQTSTPPTRATSAAGVREDGKTGIADRPNNIYRRKQ